MPNDGLSLGFAVEELSLALGGGRIDRITQPDKNQLIFSIRAGGKTHRLLISAAPGSARMHLTCGEYPAPPEAPMFCMLMRKHLTGGRILGISQIGGDRLVRIDIREGGELGGEKDRQLYFEAMGKHTNLSLVCEGRVVDAMRRVTEAMSRIRRVFPGEPYEMPPLQDKLAPGEAKQEQLFLRLSRLNGRLDRAVAESVRGLSMVTAREIVFRLTGDMESSLPLTDLPRFCAGLEAFFAGLSSFRGPVILMGEGDVPMDAFPFPYLSYPVERQKSVPTLSEALDALYAERDRMGRLRQAASSLRKTVKNAIERNERKLALQEEEIASALKRSEYLAAGEALVASGNRVPRGAAWAVLPDYRRGGDMRVALDPGLSPSANAQKYFRKYKKASVAHRVVAEQKERTLLERDILLEASFALEIAETVADLRDIRETLGDAGLLRRVPGRAGVKKREKEGEAMRFISSDGACIWVGKNSRQNAWLLRQADGEDVWLHARDVPGAHVLLRAESGETGETALLEAAKLAAFFSKAHGEEVQVDFTRRKYVRKIAGAPEGHVTYTRQKALRVSCNEAFVRGMERRTGTA